MASSATSRTPSDMKDQWKNILAYGGIFLAVVVFFADALFGGKNFMSGGDNLAFYSFIPYLEEAKNAGEFPLWVPYIFSGMPSLASFLAAGDRSWDMLGSLLFSIPRTLGEATGNDTWRLAMWYTIYGWGVYTLMRVKGHARMVGVFSSLAAVFSTFVIVWIMIGHNIKPVSMATLPWILLALERLRERFTLANLFLLILPLVVLVTATHPQMMFYIGCATALYMLTELAARAVSKEGWIDVLKAGGGLAIAGVIALGTHADMFLATREYTPESTRGSAPLVQSQTQQVDQTGGNDYEYATNWSFSPEETLTFLIPNYYGFGNLGVTAPGSKKEQRDNLYWGQMPFTDAANYMGIGVLLLAIIGAWNYRRDPFVIFLIVLGVFSLLLSFGKNAPLLYDIFYHGVPAFNKFRAPSMALCLLQFAVPVLAGYGLSSLVAWHGASSAENKQRVKVLGIASAAALAFVLFMSTGETTYTKQVSNAIDEKVDAQTRSNPQYISYRDDRAKLTYSEMSSDARTSALVLAAFALLTILVVRGTVKPSVAMAVFLLLLIVDLWRVDKRPYEPQKGSPEKNVFETRTDLVNFITTNVKGARIADLTRLPTPNWWAFHFVEHVHGYSSAKLRIYQDMLDVAGPGPGREPMPGNSMIYNPFVWDMLNVKYIIADQPLYQNIPPVFQSADGQTLVYENRSMLPRAWFVDTLRVESNPRVILDHLREGDFNARTTAYVSESVAVPAGVDSTATVRVEPRSSNQSMKITTTSSTSRLLVASEVYYDEWQAYIDGAKAPTIKVNNLIRGVVVPAGSHTVEFKYESPSFEQGRTISIASNIAAALIGLAGLGFWLKRRKEHATA